MSPVNVASRELDRLNREGLILDQRVRTSQAAERVHPLALGPTLSRIQGGSAWSTTRTLTRPGRRSQRGKVDRKGLDAITAAQTHDLKLRHYPLAAAGYMKFLGRRPQDYFTPPSGIWRAGGLEVKVNPEVGLTIGGCPTVIKLYFKSPPLTKPRVRASIGVMMARLAATTRPDTQFGVLDVKAGKLLLPDGRWNAADIQILINGEARMFVDIWDAV